MGAVLICRDELVKSPYYIESMGIRLYSMEELAFFLYENISLAVKTPFDKNKKRKAGTYREEQHILSLYTGFSSISIVLYCPSSLTALTGVL